MHLKKSKKIGLILILLGLILTLSSFTIEKKIETKEIKEEEQRIEKKMTMEKYYGILEIPKIELKKELFEINAKENDVEKNVFVHSLSKFPDSSNGNVILAAHSGSAPNAYFKNLYKLKKKDEILLFYKGKKYTYQIDEIEYQKKTGELNIKRKEKNIILITCTKNSRTSQTIYYASLKSCTNLS